MYSVQPDYENEWLSELEHEDELEWEGGSHSSKGRLSKWKQKLKRLSIWMRIIGQTLNPPSEPVTPPPPPVIARRREDPIGQGEFELDDRLSENQRNQADGLLESLGYAAARAETEAEAEAFVGAMVPLAAQVTPKAGGVMMRLSPSLIRSISLAARFLHRNPKTRTLLQSIPSILHHTGAQLQKQLARGQDITPQAAVDALASQTYRVLSNPKLTRQAVQHAHSMQQRYRRRVRDRSRYPSKSAVQAR